MFDCNLIKTRAQKMQEYQLLDSEPTYRKMQMPMTPGVSEPFLNLPGPPAVPVVPRTPSSPTAPTTPSTPARPSAPTVPPFPPAPPEPEQTYPINPLLPRFIPAAPNISVPSNPLLPPAYASILDYDSLQYLNGYLRTQIGNYVEAEFLVGSSNIIERSGKLIGIGLNYILIEDLATKDITACDFYNIKFFRTHAHENTLQSTNEKSRT